MSALRRSPAPRRPTVLAAAFVFTLATVPAVHATPLADPERTPPRRYTIQDLKDRDDRQDRRNVWLATVETLLAIGTLGFLTGRADHGFFRYRADGGDTRLDIEIGLPHSKSAD